jgi:hypothetical protein
MTAQIKVLTEAEYESRKKVATAALAAAQVAVDEAELKREFDEITDKQLQAVRTAFGVAKSRLNGVERAWARSQQLSAEHADVQRIEKAKSGAAAICECADSREKAFTGLVTAIKAIAKHVDAFNSANQSASDQLSAFMGTLDPHQVGDLRSSILDTRRERDVINAALYEAGLWELFGIGAKDAWMRHRDSGVSAADFVAQRTAEILRTIEVLEGSLEESVTVEPEGD